MLRASVLDGFLAGTMIAMGGSVLLSCDNRYLGAALFTVALLSICLFGFNLYTGKVGFLVKEHSRDKLAVTFSGLLGNILGTLIMGLLVGIALPKLVDSASAACVNRLGQTGLKNWLPPEWGRPVLAMDTNPRLLEWPCPNSSSMVLPPSM